MTETPLRQAASPGLRQNSVGVAGMVFMVVAATAPLTAMASNLSLSLGLGVGSGTLGWLLIVGVLLAVFTTGYVALSRRVVNAGAYYAFIGFGLGRSAGSAAAFIAGIAYNMAAAAMAAATGYFASIGFATYFDVHLGWYVYAAVALAVVWALGFFGVRIASRATAVICVTQFLLLAVLAVAILVRQPGGFTFEGYSPSVMFDGNYALALVFCMLSFAGYEAAAIYGEECAAPGRSIKRATYLALALLIVVFLFSTWSLVAAFEDVATAAQEDPGTLVMRAAQHYLGSWAVVAISLLLAVSFLAASVSFHNMAARYHFSLSRAGLLPRKLSVVHRRFGTPAAASLVQIVVCVVVLLPFVLTGMDPLTNLFPAVSGVTSLAVTGLMAGAAISAAVASFRGILPGGAWPVRVAPMVAAAGLIAIGVIIVLHYREVTGSDSGYVAFMPAILVVGAAYGAIAQRRRRDVQLEAHLQE
ncbi:APC family permease [Amycolatopsis jejuensis]|uniref:APC family permease n=1 Tax=Amycolatopsis jejuensis TaxID=330084 RepID=UPI000526681C|nr:APC family permease [Amycolatopsis jejuensis]